VAFRAKLSRDTGVNLSAAFCEGLLDATFEGHGGAEETSLESYPGRFYNCLGQAVGLQMLPLALPNYLTVEWWCYREAAEVHQHREGMSNLASCLYHGWGVTEDPAQAMEWYQKAADLGDAGSKCSLGYSLVYGDARAGVAKDAARGFKLAREAAEMGYGMALYLVAKCYLHGEGVEQDAARGVTCLLRFITHDDAATAVVSAAQSQLAQCYASGQGVEVDTAQAALWCQRAADGGDADAIGMLPIIRTCTFCGIRPVHKHCERCRKVRYCDTTCQAAHWNRETNPHKGHCRRAKEASEGGQASQGGEAGSASTSAQ